MVQTIVIFYLILHVLGDFYLRKNVVNRFFNLLINALIYQILILIPFLIFHFELELLYIGLMVGLAHFILDVIIYLLKRTKRDFFFIDQIIKLFVLLFSLYMVFGDSITIMIDINNTLLKWILAMLLIDKPSNIVFKHVFMRFKPTDSNEEPIIEHNKTYKNAGSVIGTLERILMLICLINGLYSSIGLILTAKSIARYNRISEDPEFSEYYLLGTLSSVLFTIIIFAICFNLF